MAAASVVRLAAVLAFVSLSTSIPVDVGLCTPKLVPCQCGGPGGHTFQFELKRCTFFYRWKPSCKPCSGQNEDDERRMCEQYRHCSQCNANVDRCLACPPDRYGLWCDLECRCQNGANCEHDGQCSCLPGFQGRYCEKPLACPPPFPPNDGTFQPEAASYSVGSTVSFRCNPGFLLEGLVSVECLPSTRWSALPPICVRECALLSSPNDGSIKLKPGRLFAGTTVRFECNPGFTLSGSGARTCQFDGTWSGTQPHCDADVACEPPKSVDNSVAFTTREQQGSDGGDVYYPGSQISYTCEEGFVLVGDRLLTCDDDGKWSNRPPLCIGEEFTCANPGTLVNGGIRMLHGVQGGNGVFLRDSEIEFFCDPLHFPSGNRSKNTAVCTSNGNWSSPMPKCVKVPHCKAPDELKNGRVDIPNHSASYRISMSRRSSLPAANRRRIATGPRSKSDIQFPESKDRPLPDYEQLQLPLGHYHTGTKAYFECESKYFKLHGSRTRTCMVSGEWSGTPTICIPECGRSSDPRTPFVTHGSPSSMGQWPWQVLLVAKQLEKDPATGQDLFANCGGSLIDTEWVLTAAHCVTVGYTTTPIPKTHLRLWMGKYYRNDSMDDNLVQTRQVHSILVHDDYDPFILDSDIALIHLASPVVLTSRVQPVCLPKDNDDESDKRLREGNVGVVTGWGETENKSFPFVLQHVPVPVVESDSCLEAYRKKDIDVAVTPNMFCAGYRKGQRDSCNGDSGGPLVFKDKDSRWVQEGIVSWGSPEGCGNEDEFGGYTRVQRFIDWIHHFV